MVKFTQFVFQAANIHKKTWRKMVDVSNGFEFESVLRT